MTRREAAAHLRVSVDTIARRLVPDGPQPTTTRMRFVRLPWTGANGVCPIRVRRADVEAILP